MVTYPRRGTSVEHLAVWYGAPGSRPVTRGNTAGRRSFGAIENLASGGYRARYKVDGRWLNALTTFPSKAEAGIFLDSVRTDMVRGAWKAPPVVRMTVEEYGQKWIEQRQGLKASTRAEYESC